MNENITVKIRGKRQSQIKEKAEKLNRSAFLYTINTNQRYKEGDPAIENDEICLEDSIKDVLQHLPQYISIKESGKAWDKNSIKDVDIDYTIERGSTYGALHAHILIKIKHTTKVHLAYGKIKEKVCADLGLENVYTDNRVLGASAWSGDFLESYVNKSR